MTTDELLTDLGASQTDLARIIETVVRDRPPFIVVATQAVRAWERRETETWAKVTRWPAFKALGAAMIGLVAVNVDVNPAGPVAVTTIGLALV